VLLDANKEGIKEFIAIIIDTGKFPTNVEITIVWAPVNDGSPHVTHEP
jgi:hypothetical protein